MPLILSTNNYNMTTVKNLQSLDGKTEEAGKSGYV